MGADDEGELGDLFADREAPDPFEEAEESLRRQGVRRALDALPERERRILELRFGFEGEPWTLEAIGHALDLTRDTIVITSDHGHIDAGGHGGDETVVITEPFVLAGAGVKGGLTHGSTDDIGSTVVENKVHVHDFHATILHLLGMDHEKLTFRHGGRDYRLTDVHGSVVQALLA